MLLVPCPNCGPRNAADFSYVGEAKARPDPGAATLAEWRDYLYMKDNPAGLLRETWYCRSGCRQYFVLERDTAANRFADPPLPAARADREGEEA